jgi:hypothetical protein
MAQLVARLVRNEKVRGSNPLSSTTWSDQSGRVSRLVNNFFVRFLSSTCSGVKWGLVVGAGFTDPLQHQLLTACRW